VIEREDGPLLRAKAIPNGMLGYLLGKVVNISAQIVFAVAYRSRTMSVAGRAQQMRTRPSDGGSSGSGS
jgi:hypothetical protein